jgi:hypothetical protein
VENFAGIKVVVVAGGRAHGEVFPIQLAGIRSSPFSSARMATAVDELIWPELRCPAERAASSLQLVGIQLLSLAYASIVPSTWRI